MSTQATRSPTAIATYVHCADPISLAGVVSQLKTRVEVRVVDDMDLDRAAVAVVVCNTLDKDVARVIRALCRGDRPRIVLVAATIDDTTVVAAAEAGVSGLLRRSEATPDALVRSIRKVAEGQGDIPGDLLAGLLAQVGRLQRQVLAPRGLTFSGLTPRETEILRLVAEGHDTAEIADQMSYSERTVKNALHDLTTRLQLRNRTHAVAYAMREGLI